MTLNGGGKGTVGIPLAAVLTVLGMFTGGVTTFYGTRDKAVADARAELVQAQAAMRAEYREALGHYVSREDFAAWREQNRAREDAQYYDLMAAIQRVGDRIRR